MRKPIGFIPRRPAWNDDLFARDFKSWRERQVALNFIGNLPLRHRKPEIRCIDQGPVDVAFRAARFQVKEVMDSGRRRHDEFKEARARAFRGDPVQSAHYSPKDLTPQLVGDRVLQMLERMSGRYSDGVRRDLDMLVYVNLQEHWYADGPFPAPDAFMHHGWRSVSAVVFAQHSLVFSVTGDAPKFLKESLRVVRWRWDREVEGKG